MAMRRVREILRYRFEDGLGHKAISYRVGAAPSTVRETLRRAEAAGLAAQRGDHRHRPASNQNASARKGLPDTDKAVAKILKPATRLARFQVSLLHKGFGGRFCVACLSRK
jgi:transposase